jgi:hypothetical protein
MATMGKYCKAYLLKQLRAFRGWTERAEHARPEKPAETPRPLTDDSIVYLQENYVVTDDIFQDEHILFDQVTPEWMKYCQEELHFEIPVYEPVKVAEQSEQQT